MTYVILIDDKAVETAETEDATRDVAHRVQKNAHRYIDDEFNGGFATVGFALTGDTDNVSYIKPRDHVQDALVPKVFKQFR